MTNIYQYMNPHLENTSHHQQITSEKGAWIYLLHLTGPDVVIATETWLDGTIRNSELESDSYTIYMRDRKTGINGGVMIAINSSITSTEV